MVIDGIKTFLETCPYLNGAEVGIDFLGSDAYEYTVEIMPEGGTIRKYTDGECIKQVGFVFASRNFYGADNCKNIEFYENFSLWLDECTENGTLPTLGEKYREIPNSVQTYLSQERKMIFSARIYKNLRREENG